MFIFTLKIAVAILLHSCKPSPIVGTGEPELFKAIVDFRRRMFHDDKYIFPFFDQILFKLMFSRPLKEGVILRGYYFALFVVYQVSFMAHISFIIHVDH